MSRRRTRGAVFCLLLGAATAGSPGCAAWCVEGDTIMTHRKGDAPEPREAPSDGEYALHNMYWKLRPIRTRNLWRGDPLGFRREGEDKVVAIAGDREYVLNDGNYVWKRR